MIRMRIQIEDGEIQDTVKGWGLIPLDADRRTAPPEKKNDESSYIEEPGSHPDPRTVYDTFTYKAQFAINAPNRDLKNANSVIARFNTAIRTKTPGSTVMAKKKITLYNDRDRVVITGYPELIAEPKSLYRRQDGSVMDCAEVELEIKVTDPTECDFDLSLEKD